MLIQCYATMGELKMARNCHWDINLQVGKPVKLPNIFSYKSIRHQSKPIKYMKKRYGTPAYYITPWGQLVKSEIYFPTRVEQDISFINRILGKYKQQFLRHTKYITTTKVVVTKRYIPVNAQELPTESDPDYKKNSTDQLEKTNKIAVRIFKLGEKRFRKYEARKHRKALTKAIAHVIDLATVSCPGKKMIRRIEVIQCEQDAEVIVYGLFLTIHFYLQNLIGNNLSLRIQVNSSIIS